MKKLILLGSTGSIGSQCLDVVRNHPDQFEITGLAARKNLELFVQQVQEFQPSYIGLTDEATAAAFPKALVPEGAVFLQGPDCMCQMARECPGDVAVLATVGAAGFKPTFEAIQAGKNIALANKETLVVAGELINELCQQYRATIIPVDSEHAAIFQCLVGEGNNPIEKLILTASGGPFRTYNWNELEHVTPAQALKHPNWDMGAKITIDSASMMNKGFEVIEAKWLFGVSPRQIEVVVHPQSIIHSMVQFADSSIKAQMGLPDMKLPIQYAFTYPERVPSNFPRLDFSLYPHFTFEKPDMERFRNLAFAYEAIDRGGNMPCILNAANEVVVAAFLREKAGFLEMSDIIESVMAKMPFIQKPVYDDYVQTDREARNMAASMIKQ